MLRLPQNEQLKVLKMLCQPRNHYVKALPEKYSQKEHQNNLEKNRQPMAIGLKAIASRVEAIASRVEAMAIRLEAIASRVEAIASWVEAMAIRLESSGWRPSLVVTRFH